MSSSNEDQLLSYFERSTERVRRMFERIEQEYAAPALQFGETAFKKYPTTTTFLTTFALLSLLPVLSFIGFSVFILTSTTFVALFLAFAVSTLAIAFITSLLCGFLLVLALISAGLSAALISSYLFARLFVLVRADGRAGLSEWSNETKARFIQGEIEEARGRRRSSDSTRSVVVVKPEPEKPHFEPPLHKVEPRGDADESKCDPLIDVL